VVREIIQKHREAASEVECREEDRFDFIQPVKVTTEDQREYTLISRDISLTGIRLIGTRRFLGQKLRVEIPRTASTPPSSFLVRILWTCAISDELYENGGTFLEIGPGGPPVSR
jgi:hypothetical protein